MSQQKFQLGVDSGKRGQQLVVIQPHDKGGLHPAQCQIQAPAQAGIEGQAEDLRAVQIQRHLAVIGDDDPGAGVIGLNIAVEPLSQLLPLEGLENKGHLLRHQPLLGRSGPASSLAPPLDPVVQVLCPHDRLHGPIKQGAEGAVGQFSQFLFHLLLLVYPFFSRRSRRSTA